MNVEVDVMIFPLVQKRILKWAGCSILLAGIAVLTLGFTPPSSRGLASLPVSPAPEFQFFPDRQSIQPKHLANIQKQFSQYPVQLPGHSPLYSQIQMWAQRLAQQSFPMTVTSGFRLFEGIQTQAQATLAGAQNAFQQAVNRIGENSAFLQAYQARYSGPIDHQKVLPVEGRVEEVSSEEPRATRAE